MDKDRLISGIEVEEAEVKYTVITERLGPGPITISLGDWGAALLSTS
jgi:hypothetical protein